MSTYLIAFIVSDFKYLEYVNESSIHYRVYTHSNQINQTAYALSESQNLLNAIADYTQVSYSISKMDQAAVPHFAAGGNLKLIAIWNVILH